MGAFASSNKLHRRCQPRSSAVQVLGLLTLRFPQFKDWRDSVIEEEHEDVEALTKEFPVKFSTPTLIPVADTLFPPPGIRI